MPLEQAGAAQHAVLDPARAAYRATREQPQRTTTGRRSRVDAEAWPVLLPAMLVGSPDSALAELGFELGDLDPEDPRYRAGRLPAGWSSAPEAGSATSVFLLDELGRRRVVADFASSYKNPAYMRIESLASYLEGCRVHGWPVVTDPVWARPQAVTEAVRVLDVETRDHLEFWSGQLGGIAVRAWGATERPLLEAALLWYGALLQDFADAGSAAPEAGTEGVVWRHRPGRAAAAVPAQRAGGEVLGAQ